MKRLMLTGLSILVMATVVIPFASEAVAGSRTCNGESLRFCTGNGR